jgi:predicted DNA-binding protein (MmcQ/YjbR family)
MNPDAVARYLLQLPGMHEERKWGNCRVFSIAGNKMIAILDLMGSDLAFKVDQDLFLGFTDRPGIRPAPYLARAHWISMAVPYPLTDVELQTLLRRSHQLVVDRLPKLKRIGLLLD